MLSEDLSLVGFTLAIQMAVGLLAVAAVFEGWVVLSDHQGANWAVFVSVMKTVFVLLVVGNFAATFHLSNLKNAIHSLRNLKSSWLSREVLLTMILTGYVILLTPLAIFRLVTLPVFLAAIAVSAIIGIVLLFVMSKVYLLRTVATWNRLTTPLDFVIAALLLGLSAYISIKVSILPSFIPSINPDVLILTIISVFAVGIRLTTILFISLQQTGSTPRKQPRWIIMQTMHLAGGLIFLITAVAFHLPMAVYLAVILIAISEIMGRIEFYNSYKTVGI